MSLMDLGITFIQDRPEQNKPGMGTLPTAPAGLRGRPRCSLVSLWLFRHLDGSFLQSLPENHHLWFKIQLSCHFLAKMSPNFLGELIWFFAHSDIITAIYLLQLFNTCACMSPGQWNKRGNYTPSFSMNPKHTVCSINIEWMDGWMGRWKPWTRHLSVSQVRVPWIYTIRWVQCPGPVQKGIYALALINLVGRYDSTVRWKRFTIVSFVDSMVFSLLSYSMYGSLRIPNQNGM